ncbi:MAG: DUF4240 domain-containing protein [Tepidisphaeraceae bacterium]
MDDKQFWSMIEQAWSGTDGSAEARQQLAQGELDEEGAEQLVHQSWTEVVPALQAALEQLSKDDLLQFDRILERKLFDLDRAEIQQYTDGSDDGFLYCRGFIVVAGQAYYDAVNADPSRAMTDLECEDVCYLPARIYNEKFGDMPASGISRESTSNAAGWTEEDD